jgi:transposase
MKNMVKNHCLAKSINDASWYQFRVWLEYFGKVFEKVTVAVNPQYTSFRMLELLCNCEENAIYSNARL